MIRATRLPFMLLALLAGACAGQAPSLVLSTDGGDAWSFDKRIDGTVVAGTCDDVAVTSPAGAARAWREGDRFAARVPLQEGTNELLAVCYTAGRVRGTSAVQRWTVRLRDVPKAWVRTVVTSDGLTLDAGRSESAPARRAAIVRYEWRAGRGNPAPLYATGHRESLDASPADGRRIVLQTPSADGEYQVALLVIDALGRTDMSYGVFRVANGKPVAVDLAREHPAWVDDAVVYGVVPFLFGPRGFDDVTERLDEIAAVGATVLWLSPINVTPKGDFGYAVTDHFRLRDNFGTEVDLRELVEAAHARGLRVIMDFIPNHASDQHPYYADTAERGDRSPYFDFFDRKPAGEATNYFDWDNLKNLNFDSAEVQRYVIESFARWIRDFDVDGFRVDVSWGIRERAPEFWPRWREELKRIKPDLFLLAEASARDPYYLAHGFDAAYDWTTRLGEWAWHDAFEDGVPTAARLRTALANDGAGRNAGGLVLRFLTNNDTGKRFVTRYGPGRTRVAAAMLFTLPGVPSIYTGEEVGAEYEPYTAPPPLNWADPHGLRPHYASLAALRRAQPALRSPAMQLVETSHSDQVLAYLRPGASPRESLLVMLNFGSSPARVSLSQAQDVAAVVGSGRAVDVLSGETVAVRPATPAIMLPAHGARVLRRASSP